jgi:hypothetical protein
MNDIEVEMVDIYLEAFDMFVNNVICRHELNQEQAERIFRTKIVNIFGRNHPFNSDLITEMIHYNSNEYTTEQFGEYLKQKRAQFKEMLIDTIINKNNLFINHENQRS